jgi:uncharacterized membrane protein YcjF (UPF0283 family)
MKKLLSIVVLIFMSYAIIMTPGLIINIWHQISFLVMLGIGFGFWIMVLIVVCIIRYMQRNYK